MIKNKPISILVVDDDPSHRFMLRTMIEDWGWLVEETDDGSSAVEAVYKKPFDAILMDVRMTRMDGMTALGKIHNYNPAIPIVIMTAFSSIDAAVEAIKSGAHDYLTKPLNFERLKSTFINALNHKNTMGKSNSKQEPILRTAIIGGSPPIKELLEMISHVAPSEATVLITGESGTGKELIARAVHENSKRQQAPFITVNCAALVENLLESELFGHEKGSFTGADRRREGKFFQADNGTLFLDEIGEMSPAMQAKLLRVLQENEIQRVGGQETIKINVRVVTATNRTLEDEVRAGTFREDLFYRLNVVTLAVPSLRERQEDIPVLAEHFLNKYSQKNNRQVAGITPQCMDLMIRYPWPGNVRELENAVERGIILMRGDYLDEKDLPFSMLRWAEKQLPGTETTDTQPSTLEAAEKEVILKTLEECGGNKSEAARRLNITRKTLLSKLNKYQDK
ncbi:MAG: sigma-54 dependent transcriptional regulator [Proteobacteria bacterium]|nr:sigma-54 dependent transcriptional regulator [Pseudomonadota bacterium]MBU1709768.1 sigma-54 dependent transcriptional regulator [Pseudomonadota bacterium]